ncbi:unnamed protein product [Paramecium sonneborni]|uniref:Uncharacterized protein n=1 Tax=Paramecium sonneborni TaxID=65129 RepID=A0A8S1RPL8_9CILI|nr:unnamed protein product [Paramecium sonneborni]
MCSLFCYPANPRRAPNKYILLSLFTICEGYVVSAICCSIAKEYENGVHLIFMALSMTVLMTFGLTYACFTKQDFTDYTGLLWSFIICLFLLLVVTLLFPSRIIQIIYSVVLHHY